MVREWKLIARHSRRRVFGTSEDRCRYFIEQSRVDRLELEGVEKIADGDTKRERGWSTGSSRLDALIRQNGIQLRS